MENGDSRQMRTQKKEWMFGAINFAVSIAMISPWEAVILCRKYKVFPDELIDVLYED